MRIRPLLAWLACLGLACQIAPAKGRTHWGPYRGANTRPTSTEQDVKDFASWGGNLLRVNGNTRPLMKKEPPYDFDEDAFALYDHMIDYGEKYGVHIAIDPHTTPGTERTTTTPADKLWNDISYHEHLIRLWDKIARRYKDRKNISYDLLNEPGLPNGGARGTAADWNLLVRKLIKTIRAVDKTHTIIIEPPTLRTADGKRVNRLDGMRYLEAPPDGNVVYSPHIYEPHEFTHQGVQGAPEPVSYPGLIRGKQWNRAALEQAVAAVVEFQKKYDVPIFIGEFSAVRWKGAEANQYLRDVIEICEEHGWSWAYHSFREADVWNAEMNNENKNDKQRYPSTPRLELLKSFYQRNGK